jgi:hypothetical protein
MPIEENEKIKRVKTKRLHLTTLEIIHLRDLMSILIPSSGKTVSKALSETERRAVVDSLLWKKIEMLCKKESIPIGKDAPDFAIALTHTPMLDVMPVNFENEISIDEKKD